MSDSVCLHCEEPITEKYAEAMWHVTSGFEGEMREIHAECRARMVLGGLNHQMGLCTCCGGDKPPDPPELTRREAAIAALAYARFQTGPEPSS